MFSHHLLEIAFLSIERARLNELRKGDVSSRNLEKVSNIFVLKICQVFNELISVETDICDKLIIFRRVDAA